MGRRPTTGYANEEIPDRMPPANQGAIPVTVRLLDDDAPSPGKVHAAPADEAGQEHRLTIAPDATDVDLEQALRQVIVHELARATGPRE